MQADQSFSALVEASLPRMTQASPGSGDGLVGAEGIQVREGDRGAVGDRVGFASHGAGEILCSERSQPPFTSACGTLGLESTRKSTPWPAERS